MALKNIIQKFKEFRFPSSVSEAKGWIKKPWEITGPCASPEYLDAVPDALAYRPFAPASAPVSAYIPHAEPERVFDIKYFTRDTRRTFPGRRISVLSKAELEAEQKDRVFDVKEFPPCYLTKAVVEEHDSLPGNGYQ